MAQLDVFFRETRFWGNCADEVDGLNAQTACCSVSRINALKHLGKAPGLPQ
jgi:hypothetical protein